MKYTTDELVNSQDTFEKLRVGKILKSTMIPTGKGKACLNTKYKRDLAILSREVQFGFNLKSDNQFKTKQLKLF